MSQKNAESKVLRLEKMESASTSLNLRDLSPEILLKLRQLKTKVEAYERLKHEAIAVIGMGCRFPGGVSNPQEYWQLLAKGIDAISETESDRSCHNLKYGGFLKDLDQFDPQFFGISPREAISIDPQQRLLLEVSWEALERAAIAPNQLQGSKSGIFVGISHNDYSELIRQVGEEAIDTYYATGNSLNAAAGRLAYLFGCQGPAMAIDTACSSSLVAVHLAVQSLRRHECNLALAGGVNLILSSYNSLALSKANLMAADGRCKTFDASANGYVRGEGCGVIVLKRLKEAVADRDNILAVIRGSAVNQDGRSSGLTVPNGIAQQELIQAALDDAKVQPSQIGYLEAHGTGTSLGDPIEVEAITTILGQNRDRDLPLAIGSVKTNIGHLESASGIAGLIKVILALQQQTIPPHLHLQQLNPQITIPDTVIIPRQPLSWQTSASRLAGISSFGFSGTNAHVIVEEFVQDRDRTYPTEDRPQHLLTLSAKTEKALEAAIEQYTEFIGNHPQISLADLCFTANTGREHFEHRLAVVAETPASLQQQLISRQFITKFLESQTLPKVAFLFTGQGSQYKGMGDRLYQTQPIFRETIDRCAAIVAPYLDKSLLELLYGSSTNLLDETIYTQPALFALEYSLAQLWLSWGIIPDVVMGHSVGEYVAACLAGVFSLEDGLKLICQRAKLMQSLPHNGMMVAIFASVDFISKAIAPYRQSVSIAAVNGSHHTVISGLTESVESILQQLESQNVDFRRLNVSHAFHSPLVTSILDSFRATASQIEYHLPQIPIISNLNGKFVEEEITSIDYWCRHIVEPVQFARGIATLEDKQTDIFLEIGANPILINLGRRCCDRGLWLSSLKQTTEDWSVLLTSLSELYLQGVEINWQEFDRNYQRTKIELPTYPFQRKRYWINSSLTTTRPSQQLWLSLLATGNLQSDLGLTELNLIEVNEQQEQLNCLCLNYLHRAFENLGISLPEATQFSAKQLIERFNFQSNYRQLLTRILDLIKSRELSPKNLTPSLKLECSKFSPLRQLLERCGENLVAILQGKENPREILFPNGSFDNIIAINRELPLAKYHNAIATKLLEKFLASIPKNQKINILEIGAGTGGTTQALLPLLSSTNASYTFTDVSPLFLQKAQQEFSQSDFIDYQILDIEQDLIQQGYQLASYDLIIAANVVHATKNISKTLNNLNSLLAPLGQLWLLELTQNSLCFELSFGLVLQELEDLNLRYHTPFLSSSQWQNLLQSQGFITTASFPKIEEIEQHLIIAQTKDTTSELFRNQGRSPQHSLLGDRLNSPATEIIFQSQISLESLPFLRDHRVHDLIVLPGTAYLEMAATAANKVFQGELYAIANVSIQEALIFPTDEVYQLQLILSPSSSQTYHWKIYSQNLKCPADWKLHATGIISKTTSQPINNKIELTEIQSRCTETISPTQCYEEYQQRNINYGDSFQAIAELWRRDGEALAIVALPSNLVAEVNSYQIHPVLLDACLQVIPFALPSASRNQQASYMPIAYEEVRLYCNCLSKVWSQGILRPLKDREEETFIGDFQLFNPEGQLVAEIKGMCLKRARSQSLNTIVSGDRPKESNWLYQIQWQLQTKTVTPSSPKSGYWIILSDRTGVGDSLAEKLKKLGHSVEIIYADHPISESPHLPISSSCLGIVYLWSLDNCLSVEKNTGSLIQIVQQVIANQIEVPLWLIAQNSQPVLETDPQETALETSCLWGLGKVIALEHPQLWGGSLDLDGTATIEDSADSILQEILAPEEETQLAFRQGKRYVPRLIESQLPTTSQQFSLHSNGTYLITGGLGNLGLKVAQWLSDRGARHLVLVGRSKLEELPSSTIETIKQLEHQGIKLEIFSADVSDRNSLEAIIKTLPSLRGIIHAAGIGSLDLIAEMSPSSLAAVLKPKVHGAWILHQLTQSKDLDFFVLFSSAAAVWGAKELGHYAAANHYLDTLALYRHRLGLPALSINWGSFTTRGMVSSAEAISLAQTGIKPLPLPAAFDLMGDLIVAGVAQQTVVDLDRQKFKSVYETKSRSPLLEKITSPPDPTRSISITEDWTKQLQTSLPNQRQELLINYLQEELRQILNLDRSEVISRQTRFFTIGIDSLMAVEFKTRLESKLNHALSSTIAFDYPNLEVLSGYLLEEILHLDQKDHNLVTPASDRFSEAELVQLLAEELNKNN
ncbi:MAG: SDR family NAD(P)-dependent oxidoreductase [Pleurocapsa sp.]